MRLSIFILFSIISLQVRSENPAVNILIWWDYIDKSLILKAEKQCGVRLNLNQYYTSSEFSKQFDKDKYDIAVYSDTSYPEIMSKIIETNIDISDLSKGYHPRFIREYREKNLPKNTLFFQHAITGILWNTDNSSFDHNSTIKDVFSTSGGDVWVMFSDSAESMPFMSMLMLGNPSGVPLKSRDMAEKLNNISHGKRLLFSNNLGKVAHRSDFSLAYVWSGEAVYETKNKNNFDFTSNNKISSILSDYLTVLNDKKSSVCVGRFFSQKETSLAISDTRFYFPPYPYPHKENAEYPLSSKVHKVFYENIEEMNFRVTKSKSDKSAFAKAWRDMRIIFKSNYEVKSKY